MFRITLNRVRDHVVIREGTDELKLTVDADPRIIVSALQRANKALVQIKDGSTDEEKNKAATALSAAIFGQAQAEQLFAFYGGDPGCVVTVCGQYFEKRLAKKITRAQKRAK